MASRRTTISRAPAEDRLPTQRARERSGPEADELLRDAIRRARRSGRGVVAVRWGSRVVSARPSRTVAPGVILFIASSATDGG